MDNQNKIVFNGSVNENTLTKDDTNSGSSSGNLQKDVKVQKQEEKSITPNFKNEGLLDILLSAKEQYDNISNNLLKKKRKKKKKNRDF